MSPSSRQRIEHLAMHIGKALGEGLLRGEPLLALLVPGITEDEKTLATILALRTMADMTEATLPLTSREEMDQVAGRTFTESIAFHLDDLHHSHPLV